MTARQPRTPQEAAALDPTGLIRFPLPPKGGLFGATTRRRNPLAQQMGFISNDVGQDIVPAIEPAMQPPPISSAPPPPADWKNTLGPELMANLPRIANGNTLQPMPLPPSPPMRGGTLGSSQGMFGSAASAGLPQLPSIGGMASDKIGNRGAPPLLDANGKGKKGFDWRFAAGILGDALGSLNGQAPIFAQNMWKLRQQQAEHRDRMEQMREQTRLKLSEPDFATINNRRVKIDPTTGHADVLYTAPQDFEDYAASLGAEPGTPAFDRLVQDYVMRGSGPTATENYNLREDHRQANREELEGIRQDNRIGLQTHRQAGQRALKGVPTYRQANPVPPRSGSRSGGSGSIPEGATATGPGGAKMIRRGGKWVDLK